MDNIYDVTLKHPSRMLISGPSGSGKTSFVTKLLENMYELFGDYFDKIVYCSNQGYTNYDIIHGITINKINYINDDVINDFNYNENNLLILDDCMHTVASDLLVSDLFTKLSHHKNITVILLIQNLFPKSKYMRDISTNSTYIVLMNNPRETLQIKILSSQINANDSKFIYECYLDATKNKPFSYLFLDFDQNTPSDLRVRTNIFPDETQKIVYVKNKKH